MQEGPACQRAQRQRCFSSAQKCSVAAQVTYASAQTMTECHDDLPGFRLLTSGWLVQSASAW